MNDIGTQRAYRYIQHEAMFFLMDAVACRLHAEGMENTYRTGMDWLYSATYAAGKIREREEFKRRYM